MRHFVRPVESRVPRILNAPMPTCQGILYRAVVYLFRQLLIVSEGYGDSVVMVFAFHTGNRITTTPSLAVCPPPPPFPSGPTILDTFHTGCLVDLTDYTKKYFMRGTVNMLKLSSIDPPSPPLIFHEILSFMIITSNRLY